MEKNMVYEEVIRKIRDGLSGDDTRDIKYLREQMPLYNDHPMRTEIQREIGRMIGDRLFEEDNRRFAEAVKKDNERIDEALENVRRYVHAEEYDKAQEIMTELVKEADENPMFRNDEVSVYFNFSDAFEEILYEYLHHPKREIRTAGYPYTKIYFHQGSLFIDEKKYIEARECLDKAKRWNPTNTAIAFEYAETYKIFEEYDVFAELTREIFTFAYTRKDYARALRNMGYYLVEREDYKAADGCYRLSLLFDPDCAVALSELEYITSCVGGVLRNPTVEELIEYGTKYDFPIGPDKDVIGLACAYGKLFAENGSYVMARYCFGIAYELTKNEELKEKIDAMPDTDYC